MRAQALLYTGTGTAVSTIAACTTGAGTLFETANNGLGNLLGGLTLANTACVSTLGTPDAGASWAVAASLSTGNGYFCVDSTGTAKKNTVATSPATAITVTSCN